MQTDSIDLYQAHRNGHVTSPEKAYRRSPTSSAKGDGLCIGVSEWTARPMRASKKLADELGTSVVPNQLRYLKLSRVIEGEAMPAGDERGISQVAWPPRTPRRPVCGSPPN